MLDGQNLTVSAGRYTLLSDVSCSIAPGRVMAIIGPNGAGKTTLMRCLTGETKPDAGQVTLDGHDIRTLSPARLAVRRAVLTQKSVLSFPFSVSEVVNLGLHANATTGHERARIVGDALRVERVFEEHPRFDRGALRAALERHAEACGARRVIGLTRRRSRAR